jgi:hypothetical protein
MEAVSPNVVILTRQELREIEDAAFKRGVERGIFEAATPHVRVAGNCANWSNGLCEACGVAWQSYEVAADFRCTRFLPRPAVASGKAGRA